MNNALILKIVIKSKIRKEKTYMCVYLRVWNGKGAVTYQLRLQRCVMLFIRDIQFIATTQTCKKLLWLKNSWQEFGFVHNNYSLLSVDSQSAIK